MEQEQHVAEDARRFAEQEAEAHRLVAEEAQVTPHPCCFPVVVSLIR